MSAFSLESLAEIIDVICPLAGLRPVYSFKFRGQEDTIDTLWRDTFTTPVEVTGGRPCYDKSRGFENQPGTEDCRIFQQSIS